jgi:hypothetical protein
VGSPKKIGAPKQMCDDHEYRGSYVKKGHELYDSLVFYNIHTTFKELFINDDNQYMRGSFEDRWEELWDYYNYDKDYTDDESWWAWQINKMNLIDQYSVFLPSGVVL